MEAAHLLAFNAALLAALLSPGPAMLYAVRTTLARGGAAGVAAGIGLASAAALWTGLALLGVDRLFALFPWAYAAFKALGGPTSSGSRGRPGVARASRCGRKPWRRAARPSAGRS